MVTISKDITLDELYELMCRYTKNKRGRHLFIHKSPSSYGNTGAIFFALAGSPPKGYAIHIPELSTTIILDSGGNRLAKVLGRFLDLDSIQADFDIYIPLDKEGGVLATTMGYGTVKGEQDD